jgi:2-(1,2-epoxy-1,2-dihydrophenyl)acetyl-CoA isomerase
VTVAESADGGGGCVRWQVDGSIARISFDAPARRNALGREDWLALHHALGELDRTDVAALVLAGGDQWFCAGFNVRSIQEPSAGILAAASTLPLVNGTLRRLWNYPKPVVAAVEGAAIGAGMALAVAADLVVAGQSAFFAPPTVMRGLVPDVGVAWVLEHRLGHQRAAALVLLGERLTAEDGARAGLVNRVVPDTQSAATATELAGRLAGAPADTVRLAKVMLRRAGELSLDSVLAGEEAYVSINSMSPAARQARESFFGRGSPSRS